MQLWSFLLLMMSFATQLHATTGNLMPGREETWQRGKMRRRKSFGSSMMTVVSMITSTPPR
jgi:hypothetical protein